MLKIRNVSCGYGTREVVHNISFDMEAGQFVCMLGPNGCGKTTLLKTVLGILTPMAGSITLEGSDIGCMRAAELGRTIGYIPQAHTPPFPFSVLDVVLMGRTPHLNTFSFPGQKDRRIALEALDELKITDLKDQKYTRISGGERQLVLIARALAQQPRMLVMDEPTSSLDFGNQSNVMEKMSQLSRKGMSILMVTHNPDHALFCADKVVMMKDGRMLQEGKTEQIVNEESIQEMYHTKVKIDRIHVEEDRFIQVCVPVPAFFQQRLGA